LLYNYTNKTTSKNLILCTQIAHKAPESLGAQSMNKAPPDTLDDSMEN